MKRETSSDESSHPRLGNPDHQLRAGLHPALPGRGDRRDEHRKQRSLHGARGDAGGHGRLRRALAAQRPGRPLRAGNGGRGDRDAAGLAQAQAREPPQDRHGAVALLPSRVAAGAPLDRPAPAGRDARAGRGGTLLAAGRLPRRGRRPAVALPDRTLPQVPQGLAVARDRGLPAARGHDDSSGPARGLARRKAPFARAGRRARHPDAARVLSRRRPSRPALETVGADAPLDRSRARGGARPGRVPGRGQRAPGADRRGRAGPVRERRGPLRRTGAAAAVARGRGRLPGARRQGRGAVGPHAAPPHPGGSGAAGADARGDGPGLSRRCARTICGGSSREPRLAR